MRFYNGTHGHYCGIDLHAKSMYLCILDREGEIVHHRNHKANPDELLSAVQPYSDDVVIAAECMFTWYWMADTCAEVGLPFVLGHALYMKAIHGGKAKNDRIDAHKIAVLLRGGMLPMAYVYPRRMRPTRDLLRRRTRFVRKKAELLTHIHGTKDQENLPDFEKPIQHWRWREGIEERFEDPTVRMTVEADKSLIDAYDHLVRNIEDHVYDNAKLHDGNSLARLRSVPGIGRILGLTILYEVGDIHRFERVQDFASYSRLVKPAKESAGKRLGHSGKKIGNAHLKWAFSEAALLYPRHSKKGMKLYQRLLRKHGRGKSLTVLAHKLGRAAYFMLKRQVVFDEDRFVA